jgi:hypothetical protein
MSSLMMLVCLIGIGWAIHWTVDNDDVPTTGRLRGFFALRHPEDAQKEPPASPASRRFARGRRPVRAGAPRKAP